MASAQTSTQNNSSSKAKLPKLDLTDLIQTQVSREPNLYSNCDSTNDSKMLYPNEKAIDSNRAVAFTYYTRRLIIRAWKAFYTHRLESNNKKLYDKVASHRRSKNLVRHCFKELRAYAKQHPGYN